MPFEIPQPTIEAPAKVGQYQDYAEAILRGCAITRPITGVYLDGHGGACALGALFVGCGASPLRFAGMSAPKDYWQLRMGLMRDEYSERYGTEIQDDNDGGMTREEITARIAAL